MNNKLDTKGIVIMIAQVIFFAAGVLGLVLEVPVLSIIMFTLQGIVSAAGNLFGKPDAEPDGNSKKQETISPEEADAQLTNSIKELMEIKSRIEKELDEEKAIRRRIEIAGAELDGLGRQTERESCSPEILNELEMLRSENARLKESGGLVEQLKAENTQLKDSSDSMVEQLRAENDMLKETNAFLEQGQQRLKDDYDSIKEQLDLLSRQAAEKETAVEPQVSAETPVSDEALREIEELKAENLRLRDANGWLEQGHAKLKEDYESIKEQLELLSSRASEEQSPSFANASNPVAADMFASAGQADKGEIEKLRKEIEHMRISEDNMRNDSEAIKSENERLKGELARIKPALESLKSHAEITSQSEKGSLIAENDRLKAEADALRKENAELNQGVLTLRESNDDLTSKLKSLKNEMLKNSNKEKDAMVASGAEFGEGQGVVLNKIPVVRTVLFDERLLNDRSNIDICLAANDTIDEMRPFANRANIRMTVVSSEKSVVFRSNGKLMKTLMRNIVDNSIKYMKRPGNMFITITDAGEDVFIVCKDDGMGIDAEELGYIFDLNFQGSNRVSGNGLGLTQARDIVNAYGGTIYAKSSPGTGMGIYIQLPKNGFGGAMR